MNDRLIADANHIVAAYTDLVEALRDFANDVDVAGGETTDEELWYSLDSVSGLADTLMLDLEHMEADFQYLEDELREF